jgi:(1->4)-alpha-D-glucan 1-alpha-D-glucosylmutase
VTGDAGLDEAEPLLERQHYRLAYWRVGRFEGNYRRFFDIDGLVGLRIEDSRIYERTHPFILDLAADRRVAGFRVDHVDGLADPSAYLARLRGDIDSGRPEPASLVVEKILGDGEGIPADWPVEGTTGYEFAHLSTAVFVDPAGAAAIEAFGADFSGEGRGFDQIDLDSKRFVLAELFPGQLDRLATLARRALDAHRPGHDLAIRDLRLALGELTASLDVYRTYLDRGPPSRSDRSRLGSATARAHQHLAGEARRALGALVELLVVDERGAGGARGAPIDPTAEFALRWQQLTGAVAAKGTEDTACYRFPGLISAAEVGGNPRAPSVDPEQLHRDLAIRSKRFPGGLNAGSTHDTKRSADVRARIAVLSEMPEEWGRLVARWHGRHRGSIEAAGGPDPGDEWFCYQSLVGLWPLTAAASLDELRGRLQRATLKAAREAKRSTSWFEPNEGYERALAAFVDGLFADDRLIADLGRLLRRIGPAGATNALAMGALAATAPGVPDIYQGSELWDVSLMDPDNRRPVDFEERARALSTLPNLASPRERGQAGVGALLAGWTDGRIKLHVTTTLLQMRRASPDLFSSGRYLPLEVDGPHRDRVVAFARRHRAGWAITVLPRLILSLAGPGRFPLGASLWAGTSIKLPERSPVDYTDVLTGSTRSASRGRLRLGELLGELPVSVLRSGGPGSE